MTAAPALPLLGRAGMSRPGISIERLRGTLLWLTAFSGAFVFMEPGPYELVSLLTILVFAVTSLSLRASLMPLILLLVLYNIGFSISVIQVLADRQADTWVLVTWYLSGTAAFYAAAVGANTEARLDLLMRGTMAAALVASSAAVIGYFHLIPGLSDFFLRYERARGTFNDPNVLGAFLVLPALIALQRILAGGIRDTLRSSLSLGLFTTALLLSFSRAAWGQLAVSAVVMMTLTTITSRSSRERSRVLIVAGCGLVALASMVAILLSIEQVRDLFWQRASLEQSYDAGPLGRFGRYGLGFLMVLDQPLGIGPLQFANVFPEDPHNSYLNSFVSGGWLSGFSYLALMLVTLVVGWRFVFVAAPWRPIYIAVYAAFIGVVGESAIIDSNHWRHYFLLLGLMWGLMAASRPYLSYFDSATKTPLQPAGGSLS